MYLKNLTVFGFKSFPDKTSLGFQPGMTAIVGPNGCGKSNIADAIRWVLGEQSAKALRGGEMSDVIFNGTDERSSMSLAEVSLTMSGVEQEHLKAAGVELTFDEVTVTRRVFRDGGSEYYINKTPCRLKDIQQLFAGTGVGRSSYSIMAQGNITQVLSSRPEDRRLVFEEAAGITRFKAQKKEAVRKLESTEQNLLRVDDLIREVKRQIISLQRQAGKARRYKQYMAELQHLDTQLARHEFDLLQTDLQSLQTQREQLRAELETHTRQVVRGEDELAQLRERLSELEHAISQAQHRGLELKGEIERHQSRIAFNEERLRELTVQNSQALTDISQAEERIVIAEQELHTVSGNLEASLARLDALRHELDQRRQALVALEAEVRQAQAALQQAQAGAFAAAQQLSRVRNEINALEIQKQGNLVRLEKLSAEKVQLEEERAHLEQRLQDFARESELDRQDLQSRRLGVEERQKRLRELQAQLAQLTQELEELQRRQAVQHSRLTVLQQLESSHEGFSAGALAALQDTDRVFGTLADRIRVPAEYVVAVEAALGHHLQLVLTEQPEAAHRILADLGARKKGRASIVSLGLIGARKSTQAASQSAATNAPAPGVDAGPSGNGDPTRSSVQPSAPGCIPASDAIEGEPSVQPLLRSLLGRTWIAPDLVVATSAWLATHGECDFVTRTGEILSRHGVFTGGATNGSGQGPSSILGRKNQIAEVVRGMAELREQIESLSRQKGAWQSEQTALQASLQEAQTELRAKEVALATRQGEFNALQNALRLLHQKIDTVVYEIQSLAAQQQQGEERRGVLAAQVGQLEAAESQCQQRLAELNTNLESFRQQREQITGTVTEAKVAVATEEQLCVSFRGQQGPLQQRIRELQQTVQQRRNDVAAVLQRKTQSEAEIEESRGRTGTLQHEREVLNIQLTDLESQRDTLAADIGTREEALRTQRRRLTELQEARGRIEVELAQKQMAAQNLVDRIQQRYQVRLEDVRSECITITFAADGPARVVTLTPEEMMSAGVSTDWGAVAEQVATLQRKLDEMGPVNLVAIQEYEETEQRYQFLSGQHEDLVRAKQQLIEVINRVNTQTRTMFTDTFNRVRENFRAMFVEIFGGGKADLYLVDEGDVLESGIEIVARPPGKPLQSISLLSGGEQTMTAVALLFAIYQVRPSPFCVLDELDAALDESNISRFVRVLQRFLAHSQFIIITHNKKTIAMADVLYGITMQEQGVSRIVSVKFHKSGEKVLDHTPEPLDTPTMVPSVEEEEEREQKKGDTLEVTVVQ